MASPASAPRSTNPTPVETPRETTLLELVQAVTDVTRDEREVVQTVLHMLETGKVRLCGIFRSSPLRCF